MRPTERGHQRLLEATEEDPLGSVANLFDAAMALAVALLIAVVGAWQTIANLKEQQNSDRAEAMSADSQLPTERRPLPRLRVADKTLSGEGERLGTAYRLKSGEIVYVP